MSKADLDRIIAKKRTDIYAYFILGIGLFFRIFRIGSLTEFLGDQGRTMLILSRWFHEGVVPQVGPSVLTGQYLGPIFYYLMFPGFVLFHGDPTGQAIWMVLFATGAMALLYIIVRDLWGIRPARAVTLLWAVAPMIVTNDRIVWEPNLIPFFGFLYLLSLIRSHRGKSWLAPLLHGGAIGILVQLHYPNIFFAGLTVLYAFGAVLLRRKTIRCLAVFASLVLLGALVTMLPFLAHEASSGFADIRGIASIMAASGKAGHPRRLEYIVRGMRFVAFALGRILPEVNMYAVAVGMVATGVMWLKKRSLAAMFILIWLGLGALAMSAYTGVVEGHYLTFLLPAGAVWIAFLLHEIDGRKTRRVVYAACAALAVIQLLRSDVFILGHNDIARIWHTTDMLIARAGNRPFSFTIIHGRSYSDLHYRYMFSLRGITPAAITSAEYDRLYLICDDASCPGTMDLFKRPDVTALCYEPHCTGLYPTISLADHWLYTGDVHVAEGQLPLSVVLDYRRK
jgi:hypothetical protein